MKQSKRTTHIEALTNQVIGIMIGWSIVYFIFPLLSNLTSAELATASSAMFFIASYARIYIIRRIFEEMR